MLTQTPIHTSRALSFPFGTDGGPCYLVKLLLPSPSFRTTLRGKTSTFLLNNSLSSGVITCGFGVSSSASSLFLPGSLFLFPLPLSATFPDPSAPPLLELVPPLFVPLAVTASVPLVFATAEAEDGEPGVLDEGKELIEGEE
jgi:hypothetical protein